MLAHWDNKSENQRLVCLSEADWPDGGKCSRPLAMLQDVGGSFGPRKVDLEEWEKAPHLGRPRQLHGDDGRLAVSRGDVQAGEDHRSRPPASRRRCSRSSRTSRLTALFGGARFDQSKGMIGFKATPIPEWVRVFKQKVRQITDGPACPQ